jgi:hypothetical protein
MFTKHYTHKNLDDATSHLYGMRGLVHHTYLASVLSVNLIQGVSKRAL